MSKVNLWFSHLGRQPFLQGVVILPFVAGVLLLALSSGGQRARNLVSLKQQLASSQKSHSNIEGSDGRSWDKQKVGGSLDNADSSNLASDGLERQIPLDKLQVDFQPSSPQQQQDPKVEQSSQTEPSNAMLRSSNAGEEHSENMATSSCESSDTPRYTVYFPSIRYYDFGTYTFVRDGTIDGFTCKSCNRRAQRLASISKTTHEDIDKLHGNPSSVIFVQKTKTSRPFLMCAIAKNGCTSFKRLAMRASGKDYLVPQSQVHRIQNFHQLWLAPMDHIRKLILDKDVPLVFISRNPYVRLLSAYIDKHSKNQDYPYWGKNQNLRSQLQKIHSRSFDSFVTKTYMVFQFMGKRLSKQDNVNAHLVQQSRFCGFDFGLVYDYVLKLELVNEWYDGFVEELGLQDLVRTGWPNDDNCFMSTPQHPCDGPSVNVDKNGGVTFTSPHVSAEHVTGAEMLLRQYYTPHLVELVNEMYAEDFAQFNYTLWDGKGDPILN